MKFFLLEADLIPRQVHNNKRLTFNTKRALTYTTLDAWFMARRLRKMLFCTDNRKLNWWPPWPWQWTYIWPLDLHHFTRVNCCIRRSWRWPLLYLLNYIINKNEYIIKKVYCWFLISLIPYIIHQLVIYLHDLS